MTTRCGLTVLRSDRTIDVPKNVYLPKDANRRRGGVAFTISWERIELALRGDDELTRRRALEPDEECDFVIEDRGLTVYVDKKS